MLEETHASLFAKCCTFRAYLPLSLFLFPLASLFGFNIALLSLCFQSDLLEVVVLPTNTGCCQMMSLQFPSPVKRDLEPGTLREVCIVSAVSLPFLQSLVSFSSHQPTLSVAQTKVSSFGQLSLICPCCKGFFSFHFTQMHSCLPLFKKLSICDCHLFASPSTVYLFQVPD